MHVPPLSKSLEKPSCGGRKGRNLKPSSGKKKMGRHLRHLLKTPPWGTGGRGGDLSGREKDRGDL